MIIFQDSLRPPKGHFRLEVRRGDKLIEVVDRPNLIVIGSQVTHAHLLGGDVTNRSVTQIGYGTNLTAQAFGNTALTGAYVKAIDTTSYPAANQVSFAFSLGSGEANGMNIGEFGLLTAGSMLYARVARTAGAIPKQSDISLTGSWIISF